MVTPSVTAGSPSHTSKSEAVAVMVGSVQQGMNSAIREAEASAQPSSTPFPF